MARQLAILKVLVRREKFSGLITYTRNERKTEQHLYESIWNLQSPETASEEMNATKERLGATGGVQGYHFIQSFKPNEVTPEVAQEVGREFARCLLGSEFEAVIATHTDHDHIHNHIVVNSVNRITGKKFRSQKQDMSKYRELSDDICREYGLSVIEPKFTGKHYTEWQAEKENRPTIRGQIQRDIDNAISYSFGIEALFWRELEAMGYQVKEGKVWSVKPPFGERFRRMDNLGYNYTIDRIQKRIFESIEPPKSKKLPSKTYYNHKHYEQYGFWRGVVVVLLQTIEPMPTRKYEPEYDLLTLLFAIFADLLFNVELIPSKPALYLRVDVTRRDKYAEQYEFLVRHKLNNTNDIKELKIKTFDKLCDLEKVRDNLPVSERKPINKQMAELRKTMRDCDKILKSCGDVWCKLERITTWELEEQRENRKKRNRER